MSGWRAFWGGFDQMAFDEIRKQGWEPRRMLTGGCEALKRDRESLSADTATLLLEKVCEFEKRSAAAAKRSKTGGTP